MTPRCPIVTILIVFNYTKFCVTESSMLIVITQSSPTLGGPTELTRTPRRHRWVRTGYVRASRVGYVPEAQGGLPPRPRAPRTVRTGYARTSLGRSVRTACRGTPGGHRVGRCVFAARFDRTRIYAGCDNGEVRVFDYSSRPASAGRGKGL